MQELNETESGILQSLDWLDAVMKGDYKDLVKLQERSKSRLQALRDAALLEEQEYSIILQAQVWCHVHKHSVSMLNFKFFFYQMSESVQSRKVKIRDESVVAVYRYWDNYTEIPRPLLQLESRLSANIIIGKHKISNIKTELEEIINYYLSFHKFLMYL